MKSSLFPDVNVWLALTHRRHIHHQIAADWFRERDEAMYFCRFTQLALLRLLTNEQVMGTDLRSRQEAWQAYRIWFEDERVDFHPFHRASCGLTVWTSLRSAPLF